MKCHIVPPYMVDKLKDHPDLVRLKLMDKQLRRKREGFSKLFRKMFLSRIVLSEPRCREVFDAENQEILPGKLVRREGHRVSKDKSINNAYRNSGIIHNSYRTLFDRNSLDDRGMKLISTVHYGVEYVNAFWDGKEMVYGDGDGETFINFTNALDVAGHEMAHAVTEKTCNLVYQAEPGALNESISDVFGLVFRQRYAKEPMGEVDSWLIGREIMGPKLEGLALRCFTEGPAFEDNPYLGSDPQPKHYKNVFKGMTDNGGVHINSGIPNHAFYLFCMKLGVNSWEQPIQIWYKSLYQLTMFSKFSGMVNTTIKSTQLLYGKGTLEEKYLRQAWKEVGLL